MTLATPPAFSRVQRFLRGARGCRLQQLVCSAKPLLGGKSRLTAELPNIPEAMAKAIIGTKNVPQASNGPKQIKVCFPLPVFISALCTCT